MHIHTYIHIQTYIYLNTYIQTDRQIDRTTYILKYIKTYMYINDTNIQTLLYKYRMLTYIIHTCIHPYIHTFIRTQVGSTACAGHLTESKLKQLLTPMPVMYVKVRSLYSQW